MELFERDGLKPAIDYAENYLNVKTQNYQLPIAIYNHKELKDECLSYLGQENIKLFRDDGSKCTGLAGEAWLTMEQVEKMAGQEFISALILLFPPMPMTP